jgi:hypothetical protein
MNERADGLVERSYEESVREVCSAPQKYGSLWLKVQPHVRTLAAQHQKSLGQCPDSSRNVAQSASAAPPSSASLCTKEREQRLRQQYHDAERPRTRCG